jgi:hypothetical protein
MSNLLKDRFPEVFAQLHPTLNQDLNINILTCGMHKKLWFCCMKVPEHEPYQCYIYSKTSKFPPGCKKCQKEEKHKNRVENLDNRTNFSCAITGMETEQYVYNLLVDTQIFKNVENIGYLNGKADIVVTLEDDRKKSIQVKTLIKERKNEKDFCNWSKNYENNILVVLVDKSRKYFALAFGDDIIRDNLCYFNFNNYNHKNIMYEDENEFLSQLIEKIPLSCDYVFKADPNTEKYYSLQRLEIFCNKNNLTYVRNQDPTNPTVDCFIENIPIQCKFVTNNRKDRLTYKIGFKKSGGMLNGNKLKCPYSINDTFEYAIIEVGGKIDNPNIYLNNFCIIPKCVLVEMNILKTELQSGREYFDICPPDYPNPHWSKKFWYKPGDKIKVVNNKLVKKSKLIIV